MPNRFAFSTWECDDLRMKLCGNWIVNATIDFPLFQFAEFTWIWENGEIKTLSSGVDLARRLFLWIFQFFTVIPRFLLAGWMKRIFVWSRVLFWSIFLLADLRRLLSLTIALGNWLLLFWRVLGSKFPSNALMSLCQIWWPIFSLYFFSRVVSALLCCCFADRGGFWRTPTTECIIATIENRLCNSSRW